MIRGRSLAVSVAPFLRRVRRELMQSSHSLWETYTHVLLCILVCRLINNVLLLLVLIVYR